jgi:hypothetical protein
MDVFQMKRRVRYSPAIAEKAWRPLDTAGQQRPRSLSGQRPAHIQTHRRFQQLDAASIASSANGCVG